MVLVLFNAKDTFYYSSTFFLSLDFCAAQHGKTFNENNNYLIICKKKLIKAIVQLKSQPVLRHKEKF